MTDFFTAYLHGLGGGLAYVIIFASSTAIFLVMTFLSLDGADGDAPDALDGAGDDMGGPDAPDGDHAGHQPKGLLQYLSFRNCINYLMGFGAAGFLAQHAGLHPALAAICALMGGGVAAAVIYKLMLAMHALSEEQGAGGSEAVGQLGRVYIEVGAQRSRRGKVLVTIKSAQREFAALTDHAQSLRTNATVRVTALEGDCLLVEPAGE